MEYEILTSDSAAGLQAKVREYISKDWRPCGGVAISNWVEVEENSRKGYSENNSYSVYAQAMTYEVS